MNDKNQSDSMPKWIQDKLDDSINDNHKIHENYLSENSTQSNCSELLPTVHYYRPEEVLESTEILKMIGINPNEDRLIEFKARTKDIRYLIVSIRRLINRNNREK